MNLAYDYQRAIDAAQTLRELINSLQERDCELRASATGRLVYLRWRLEDAEKEIFIPRRDCLMPDAADETKARREA